MNPTALLIVAGGVLLILASLCSSILILPILFFLALPGIFLLVYVLILIRPGRAGKVDQRLLCPYAHRGLFGEGIPENSMAAFRRACEAGVGIELDVQTSSDGEVMVFHDYNLSRMTGKDALLSELTAAELKTLRLDGSEETIPTLREVLELVDGRVPILVEMKGETPDTSLCGDVAPILEAYRGPFCVESFNPLMIRDMKELMPGVYRGLLYTNVFRGKNEHPLVNLLLFAMAANFLAKPQFIAYNKEDRHLPTVWLATRLYSAHPFVWTVRTPEELKTAQKRKELPIFENIRP